MPDRKYNTASTERPNDFPDQEGIETCALQLAQVVAVRCPNDFPDQEGIETARNPGLRDASFGVRMTSPIRRGLKLKSGCC